MFMGVPDSTFKLRPHLRGPHRRLGIRTRRCATLAAMPQRLTLDEVRHVAKLARLQLTDEQLQQYRSQLSSVLEHIAKLSELNVEGVEPMAHPSDVTNRLDEDTVGESMPTKQLLAMAPAMQDHYLAVPKVLGEQAAP